MNKPKILVLDIETSPILGHVWGLWENNVAINQIAKDWHILSWGAKWLNNPKFMYMDQRKEKNIENDKTLLLGIWKLLDEADIVVTQNGKAFDQKKLNARFAINGMKPPSSFRHIDTLLIAKKHFAFTSNKLEYLTDKLCVKYKKKKHHKFAGFELWKECLSGNPKAWDEMKIYNKYDVLALEELYKILMPWENSVNFNVYTKNITNRCSCGSTKYIKNGFFFTNTGKYQRFLCIDCGSESREKNNQLSEAKRKSLKSRTIR